jgi:DNA recombination protein RmuC
MATIIFLAVIIVIGFIALFYFLNRKFQELKSDSSLNILSQNLSQSMQGLQQRMDRSAEVMSRVARELGAMQEIGRDMKKLQDIFRSPKLRGNIGEQILKDLLEQVLPRGVFKLQHRFREGQVVDAIIKMSHGLVPIDSKFPTEGFDKRMIKKHIDNISKKYILPQEGTVDFAIMYIPSEAIYYEILVKHQDVLEYGYQRKVFMVAPNNFYYFLKILMIGLEGAKIEEASRRILQGLQAIQQESLKLGDELNVLLRHIANAKSSGERVSSRFLQLSSKIDHVQLLKNTDLKNTDLKDSDSKLID